jgi:5'-deoxynucleotidase YfbR-like HD superfamily hydrolase
MIIEEYTKEKILEDVTRLQYLYGLKEVIRYDQKRTAPDHSESVAEHLYGMQLLAQYFLPLEDPERCWDKARIYEMITAHDMSEIENGDVISWIKTSEMRAQEALDLEITLAKAPKSMRIALTFLTKEYEDQLTIESKFCKAIDKIEPLVHVFRDNKRKLFYDNKTTAERSLSVKEPYVKEFTFISKFARVIHDELVAHDYYFSGEQD